MTLISSGMKTPHWPGANSARRWSRLTVGPIGLGLCPRNTAPSAVSRQRCDLVIWRRSFARNGSGGSFPMPPGGSVTVENARDQSVSHARNSYAGCKGPRAGRGDVRGSKRAKMRYGPEPVLQWSRKFLPCRRFGSDLNSIGHIVEFGPISARRQPAPGELSPETSPPSLGQEQLPTRSTNSAASTL